MFVVFSGLIINYYHSYLLGKEKIYHHLNYMGKPYNAYEPKTVRLWVRFVKQRDN